MYLNNSFAKSKKIKSIFVYHEKSAEMAAYQIKKNLAEKQINI